MKLARSCEERGRASFRHQIQLERDSNRRHNQMKYDARSDLIGRGRGLES